MLATETGDPLDASVLLNAESVRLDLPTRDQRLLACVDGFRTLAQFVLRHLFGLAQNVQGQMQPAKTYLAVMRRVFPQNPRVRGGPA